MATEPIQALPALADQRRLREELGVSEATAQAIFRRVPVVRIPGHRKAFVRVSDVVSLLEESSFSENPLP
jgi:hypothetical protein